MDSISKKTTPAPLRPIIRYPIEPAPLPQSPTPSSVQRDTYLVQSLPKQKQFKHSVWRRLFFIILACTIAWFSYFTWKIYHISRTMQITAQETTTLSKPSTSTFDHIQSLASSLITSTHIPLRGEEDGRINILLLGRAGEHHSGRDLTDTVMIMSIDTNTKKIALLSLPRDLYVQIPDTYFFTKINAVYQHGLAQNEGLSLIERTVEHITRLPIHYSFVIDFDGFEKVINALGGINVEVMRDIYDPRYPGPNYSYETFEIKKGWQMIDGATALKYVRERHDDPEGDFGRAKRQQQVIQAVKGKAFSLKTFADAFALNNLLTILGDSVKTTITPEEIGSFITLSKQVDTNNISNIVIDAWKPDSLLRVSHVMVGSTRMFTLVPRIGNYSEIQDVAANLFDTNAIKRRKDSITAEEASITVINRSSQPQLTAKVKKILQESFGFSQVHVQASSSILSDSTESLQNDSFIIDTIARRKPFSLDEILKILPIRLASDNESVTLKNDNATDFIIVLGNNIAKDLDFEEDSVDDFKNAEDDNIAYPKEMTP